MVSTPTPGKEPPDDPVGRLFETIPLPQPRRLIDGRVEEVSPRSTKVSFPDLRFSVLVTGVKELRQASLELVAIAAASRIVPRSAVPFHLPTISALSSEPAFQELAVDTGELASRFRRSPALLQALRERLAAYGTEALRDQAAAGLLGAEDLAAAAGERWAADRLTDIRRASAARRPRGNGHQMEFQVAADPYAAPRPDAVELFRVEATVVSPPAAPMTAIWANLFSGALHVWRTSQLTADGLYMDVAVSPADFWLTCMQNVVWGALKSPGGADVGWQPPGPVPAGTSLHFPYRDGFSVLFFHVQGGGGGVNNGYVLGLAVCDLGPA